ncbi:hypothetical protein RRX38_05395 [Pseudomonas sp. DTU_2021_1001937_2_SI_NGA_ILE_001]|uniref:hypothetical protein n=1 Tax=Pseudomonas sp. DTU_2021_1001937_2_SI_NGA_ILE_001 TaxID=3077589 RepID=UPI0025E824C3|nr:hypothetical protein [Pseudomonas sp. DTU_2021_1001937_2_SI_NGA_ILE_001]WNW10612.1 hypothetical protein RRX38_05395 [Pseudomonas sp. DTU_2021_1001937_2_SI_NGA_ILE_001]
MNKAAKIGIALGVAAAAIVTAVLLVDDSPQARVKQQARSAIQQCRDELNRFTGAAGPRNVISAACVKMENDFVVKYGHAP